MAICSQGHENKEDAKFCNKCGERVGGGKIECPHCNAELDSKAKFCNKCGKNVSDFNSMKWQREVDDFATRVDVENLQSVLQKGIIVEHGTRALLLRNGALAATLEPGRYDLKSTWDVVKDMAVKGVGKVAGGITFATSYLTSFGNKEKADDSSEAVKEAFDSLLTNNCTVILVDAGDVELQLNMTGIKTKDPLDIDVTCKVIAQIENPAFFFTNVIKGRKNYLVSEVRSALYDEMGNALNEAIGRKSITDLNYDLSLKKQFEVSVENHLRITFQRNGLTFVQLRTVDYNFKEYNKIKGIDEKTFLLISEEEAKLQQRKRLFDVYDQTQLQEIIELGKERDYREKRQKVWADMRALVNSDKMNEIKSVDDLEAFIHEVDKGKLLREDEVKELMNVFQQSDKKRAFLLRKIDLEHDLEYDRIRMVGREDNLTAEWEAQAKRKRRELEEDIRNQKDKNAHARDEHVENAKTGATVSDITRDSRDKDATIDQKIDLGKLGVDREKMNMGMDALARMKELKAREKREEMETETEKAKRLADLELARQKVATEAEIEKTKVYQQMNEDQLWAVMAKDLSADQTDALKEKFKAKGLASEEKEKVMREMLEMNKSTTQDKDKMFMEMFKIAQSTQRDVSIAAAQSGHPNVVYPPYGQPFPGQMPPGYGPGQQNVNINAGTTPEVVICSKCKSKVPTGVKYCDNCGNEMY